MSTRTGFAHEGGVITMYVDDRELHVPHGTSVAAALLVMGERAFRRSVAGEPRGPLCGMGSCHECRVTIDGVPHRRACLVTAVDGLRVITSPEAGA